MAKLKKMSQESSWGQSTLENSKYQDYVMILGESARKITCMRMDTPSMTHHLCHLQMVH